MARALEELRGENARLQEALASRDAELEQAQAALARCSGWCSAGPRSGRGQRTQTAARGREASWRRGRGGAARVPGRDGGMVASAARRGDQGLFRQRVLVPAARDGF